MRVTETGLKSTDHSLLSLESEKIMLLYCRSIVFEMKMEMNKDLLVNCII